MKKSSISRQNGFSMIEILVTVLIMVVGLLGVAAMQMLNIKTVNNTQYRSIATLHAYDMAERMRSNKLGVNAGAYLFDVRPSDAAASCSDVCDATALAAWDAYNWNDSIRSYETPSNADLPSGSGTVEQEGLFYVITVNWQEQSRDSGAQGVADEEFVLRVRI